MKRFLILFLLLGAAFGQNTISGTITGTKCFGIDVTNSGTVGISVSNSGTAWSGTIQPQVSIGGDAAANAQVYPSTSTTGQSTITANGVYYMASSGATYVQVCGNTVTNTAAVKLFVAQYSLNLRGGSSGGSGTVTSVALADSTGTFNVTGSPVTTTGTLTLGSFANQTGGTVLANNSGSSAAPAFSQTLTLGAVGGTTGALTLNGTTSNSVTLTTASTGNVLNLNQGLTLTGASGAPTTITTSTASSNLILAPAATVVIPAGSTTNASIQTSGMAANTGLYSQATSNLCWLSTGTIALCFNAGGAAINDGGGLTFSQTNAASGTTGFKVSVLGTGATEALDFTSGTSTKLLHGGNQCNFALTTGTFTLALSPVSLCAITLPNSAQTWYWECTMQWSSNAGTTPTFAIGETWAQAPSAAMGMANILTTNAGVGTQGAITTTTNSNILATATLTTSATTFTAYASGRFTASATSGTFSPTVSLTGTSATGTATGGCTIQ